MLGPQEAWPLYSCKVGAKLRELIPLRLLQAPLEEGMLVHVELPDQRGTWGSGRVLEVPLWQRTHLTSYPSYQAGLSATRWACYGLLASPESGTRGDNKRDQTSI